MRTKEAERSIGFEEWLKANFDLDDFEATIISTKAQETFVIGEKRTESLADRWLKMAK